MFMNQKVSLFPFATDTVSGIFEYLADKQEASTSELLSYLQKHHNKNLTIQGLNKSLRALAEEKVVLRKRNWISLHTLWISLLGNYTQKLRSRAKSNLVFSNNQVSLVDLQDGESISYKFSSPDSLDKFWDHLFVIGLEYLDPGKVITTWEPHDWFTLTHRKEAQVKLAEYTKNKNITWLAVIGHNTATDHLSKKLWLEIFGKHYHTESRSSFPQTNYYLNVLGDFIYEARISKKIGEEIHKLYIGFEKKASESESLELFSTKVEKLIQTKNNCSLTITKDKKLAARFRKKLGKYFDINRKLLD